VAPGLIGFTFSGGVSVGGSQRQDRRLRLILPWSWRVGSLPNGQIEPRPSVSAESSSDPSTPLDNIIQSQPSDGSRSACAAGTKQGQPNPRGILAGPWQVEFCLPGIERDSKNRNAEKSDFRIYQ
jgi:hypothetical protein